MDGTVEAALIGAAATLIAVGGTVIVAVTAARNTRRTNQATIDAARNNTQLTLDAAHADAQLTLDAAVEAQFADRYSRALEQVGSANLDVRIGGIYALEGIALNSPRNHPTVMEVLTAFIREHSRTPAPGFEPERWPLPDVQAVLTVVSRRKTQHDIRPVDLNTSDLSGGDLSGADLRGANLTNVNLTRAMLSAADLTKAVLWGADLSGAILTSATLAGADLLRADLTGANLIGANLTRADLSRANLAAVTLIAADLTGASWPNGVKVPKGWAPAGSSGTAESIVVLIRADTGPDAAEEGTPLQGLFAGRTALGDGLQYVGGVRARGRQRVQQPLMPLL